MTIKVSLIGLTRSNEQVMRIFIGSGKTKYLTLCKQEDMQAAIIDIDNLELTKDPIDLTQLDIPLIYLSEREVKHPRYIWVKKPISPHKIINAAKLLNQTLKCSNQKCTKNIKPGTPDIYDQKENLQGYFQKALKISLTSNQPAIIDCQHKKISVNAANNIVSIGVSPVMLKALCRFTFEKAKTQIFHGEVPPFNQESTMNIQQFQWTIAILCSRGRLPQDIDPNKQYQLAHWPNLTRWKACNHAMRICALWMQSALTPSEVSEQLNIDKADVFTFLVAAKSAGLILRKHQSYSLAKPNPVHEARKILASFFDKLKRA